MSRPGFSKPSVCDRQKDKEAFRDLDRVLALAALPNVVVKVTAMPCYTTKAYPYHRLHPHLRRVYNALGPERMFRGSDLSRLRGPYRECVTIFTEEMPWLTRRNLKFPFSPYGRTVELRGASKTI